MLAMTSMKYRELNERLKKAEESKVAWQRIARKKEAKVSSLGSAVERTRRPEFSSTKQATVGGGDYYISLSSRRGRREEELRGDADWIFFPCKCCGSRHICKYFDYGGMDIYIC